ncbi:hypothetical protein VTL71DRAFT_3930 [Oculimacula yallundae]|uniref:non-specific serine/threonine protein kinase n=1 Tax=Oculimacula yallundae TaxID=86028 RepID=A0ABR4C4F1_9HELO
MSSNTTPQIQSLIEVGLDVDSVPVPEDRIVARSRRVVRNWRNILRIIPTGLLATTWRQVQINWQSRIQDIRIANYIRSPPISYSAALFNDLQRRFMHQRSLTSYVQGRSYAMARLEGRILDDPNPMPDSFEEWDDIIAFYETIEQTTVIPALLNNLSLHERRRGRSLNRENAEQKTNEPNFRHGIIGKRRTAEERRKQAEKEADVTTEFKNIVEYRRKVAEQRWKQAEKEVDLTEHFLDTGSDQHPETSQVIQTPSEKDGRRRCRHRHTRAPSRFEGGAGVQPLFLASQIEPRPTNLKSGTAGTTVQATNHLRDRHLPVRPSAHPPPPTRPPPPPPGFSIERTGSVTSSPTLRGPDSAAMDNNRLTVRSPEINQVRLKAMDDARQMQVRVIEHCKKAKKDPPPYVLEELIGKGSFGRVYKGKNVNTAAVVAIKIIDIDESDTINPRNADSYSEFLKEINALKVLSEKKAKNINLIIDAMPVNQAMWMITEYCGGGSVATLMKPTAPGGLNEKWIIPILREVAEAIFYVHDAGIIHRDIKCANVLVTEQGNVQLCDFGVAGMIESKLDKRSTIIGTPHWMAPELFGASPSYGSEVDIWAFGSMVFEIATGLPPNVANGVSYDRLGSYLQNHTPRLEGGNYSNNLRDLVAYCLEEDPKKRPTISNIQRHPYILNSSSSYPTSTLKLLVGSFKVWESRGNSRHSLFMQHGAQGPAPTNGLVGDEWDFDGTQHFQGPYTDKDVIDAYGSSVIGFVDETARPAAKVSRRRPPPEALSRLPTVPLQQIFDPRLSTNYESNSNRHYNDPMHGGPSQSGPSDRSDLPLRDDSAQPSIRDTMIDLGGHNVETGLSSFPEMDTIRAGRRAQDEGEDDYNATLPNFSRPALSDPAETVNNRRTQDWKFPSMAPPASADPELSRFPTSFEVPQPPTTPGLGGRPALVHHTTEPVGAFGGGLPVQPAVERMSIRSSVIDLDEIVRGIDIPEFRRPSTANSDVGSATSEQMTSTNPFELERHASLYQPLPRDQSREPSIYVSDDALLPQGLRNGNALQELAEMSDFSASDAEGPNGRNRRDMNASYDDSDDSYYVVNPGPNEPREDRNQNHQYNGVDDRDYLRMPPPSVPSAQETPLPRSDSFPTPRFPDMPPHPSLASLTGTASQNEMAMEITRVMSAMSAQLEVFRDVYDTGDVVQRQNSNRRTERRETDTQEGI